MLNDITFTHPKTKSIQENTAQQVEQEGMFFERLDGLLVQKNWLGLAKAMNDIQATEWYRLVEQYSAKYLNFLVKLAIGNDDDHLFRLALKISMGERIVELDLFDMNIVRRRCEQAWATATRHMPQDNGATESDSMKSLVTRSKAHATLFINALHQTATTTIETFVKDTSLHHSAMKAPTEFAKLSTLLQCKPSLLTMVVDLVKGDFSKSGLLSNFAKDHSYAYLEFLKGLQWNKILFQSAMHYVSFDAFTETQLTAFFEDLSGKQDLLDIVVDEISSLVVWSKFRKASSPEHYLKFFEQLTTQAFQNAWFCQHNLLRHVAEESPTAYVHFLKNLSDRQDLCSRAATLNKVAKSRYTNESLLIVSLKKDPLAVLELLERAPFLMQKFLSMKASHFSLDLLKPTHPDLWPLAKAVGALVRYSKRAGVKNEVESIALSLAAIIQDLDEANTEEQRSAYQRIFSTLITYGEEKMKAQQRQGLFSRLINDMPTSIDWQKKDIFPTLTKQENLPTLLLEMESNPDKLVELLKVPGLMEDFISLSHCEVGSAFTYTIETIDPVMKPFENDINLLYAHGHKLMYWSGHHAKAAGEQATKLANSLKYTLHSYARSEKNEMTRRAFASIFMTLISDGEIKMKQNARPGLFHRLLIYIHDLFSKAKVSQNGLFSTTRNDRILDIKKQHEHLFCVKSELSVVPV